MRILDRDYRLAVSPEEKARLMEAVTLVDEKMRSIREAGKVSGLERIAVLAALQLAHEMLGSAGAATHAVGSNDVMKRIRRMTEELDAEIKRQESLF